MNPLAIHRHSHAVAAYGLPLAPTSGAQGADPATDGRGAAANGAQSVSAGSGPAVVNHVQPAAALPEEPGSQGQGDAGDSEAGLRGQAGAGAGEPNPSGESVDPDRESDGHSDREDAEEDPAETEALRKLQARDAEVRAHEQAHAAAGGAHAGSPRYEYERGPDGRNYAVSGEVPIDVSSVSGDPQATIQKMQQVRRAALAPASPSGADRSIASRADAKLAAARRERAEERAESTGGDGGVGESSQTDEAGRPDAARQDVGAADGGKGAAGAPPSFEALSRRATGRSAYSAPAADVGGSVSVLSCSNCGGTHGG